MSVDPGRLAFLLGAAAGVGAVVLEARYSLGAPAFMAFCLAALATIVFACGRYQRKDSALIARPPRRMASRSAG
jgi:peptidoglycan/LPS O-acetylase OafA/YrhL